MTIHPEFDIKAQNIAGTVISVFTAGTSINFQSRGVQY